MSGAGIAAFVNGVFDGIDWRDRREDRKDRNARDKELHQMRKETHTRQGESHDLNMQDREFNLSERRRQRDSILSNKKFFSDLHDDAQKDFEDGSQTPAPTAPQNSSGGPIALRPVSTPSRAPLAGADQPAPQIEPSNVAPITPKMGVSSMQPAPNADQNPNPRSRAELQPWAGQSAAMTQPNPVPDQGLGPDGQKMTYKMVAQQIGAPEKALEIADRADVYNQILQSGTDPETNQPLTDQAKNWITQEIMMTEQYLMDIKENGNAGPDVTIDPSVNAELATTQQNRMNSIGADAAPRPPIAETTAPSAIAQPNAMAKPTAAEQTPQGTPRASLTSLEASEPSLKPGQTMTPASQKKAEASFLDHYYTTASPKIIEHYLSRGEFDKADAFEKFVKSRETDKGMAAWARAIHAAAIGDDDAFISGVEDAYNANGYFDDGYEIVRKKSEMTRDAFDNVTGAKIVLRNKETGEEFERVYEDQEDLYQMAIEQLSPEAIFENGWAEVQQVQKLRSDIAKKAAERNTPKDRLEKFLKVGEYLAETDLGFSQLSIDEQMDAIQNFIAKSEGGGKSRSPLSLGASSGDVPVYR